MSLPPFVPISHTCRGRDPECKWDPANALPDGSGWVCTYDLLIEQRLTMRYRGDFSYDVDFPVFMRESPDPDTYPWVEVSTSATLGGLPCAF